MEGEAIIRKGDVGDCMYIIFSGEVNVIANDEGVITTVLSENQVFGERALVTDDLRMANIIARSSKVGVLCL